MYMQDEWIPKCTILFVNKTQSGLSCDFDDLLRYVRYVKKLQPYSGFRYNNGEGINMVMDKSPKC